MHRKVEIPFDCDTKIDASIDHNCDKKITSFFPRLDFVFFFGTPFCALEKGYPQDSSRVHNLKCNP